MSSKNPPIRRLLESVVTNSAADWGSIITGIGKELIIEQYSKYPAAKTLENRYREGRKY